MIKLNKHKTALPVKDQHYASCTSYLRSGGVVFKSKLSGVQMEFNGSARISRHSLTFKSNGDTTEQSAITNQASVNMPEIISDASEAINTQWNEVAPLTETLKGCNIAIPNNKNKGDMACSYVPGKRVATPKSPSFKITRPKQFPVQ